MRTRRPPQLNLRLNAAPPDAASRWRDGAAIAYLGGTLRLRLAAGCVTATRAGDELQLPLPPQAAPRQIQDSAEAWLRAEALRYLQMLAADCMKKSALAGRLFTDTTDTITHTGAPRIVLSFARSDDWIAVADDTLRCHWRLIEQPAEIIAAALQRALARLPSTLSADARANDLFPHSDRLH
jgi:hypothetical protein